MKLSKIKVVLIILVLSIAFSTVVNAEGGKSELAAYLSKSHSLEQTTYELDSTEKQKINEYINSDEITDEMASITLQKLQEAESTLAGGGWPVSEEAKSKAVSLITEAGTEIGLTVSIDRNNNPKTVSVKNKSGETLISTTYTIDSTYNLVFNKNGDSSSSSSGSASSSTSNNTFTYITGKGQTYYLNSGKDLIFKIDADYSLFENGGKVYMDNTELAKDNYTSSSGSTLISVKSDYAKTLKPGSHSINVEFNTGRKVPATFSVAVANPTVPSSSSTSTSSPTTTSTSSTTNKNTNTTSTNKSNTNSTTTNTSTTNTKSNTTNTSSTNTTSGQATNTNTAKTFAYTGNNNALKLLISLLAVVAVSTIYIKKINEQ